MPHPGVLFGCLIFGLVILFLAALPEDDLGAGEAYRDSDSDSDSED